MKGLFFVSLCTVFSLAEHGTERKKLKFNQESEGYGKFRIGRYERTRQKKPQ
jgi:hypothetical protein